MKHLLLIFILSSCAVFDGAKTILDGTYEAGKYAGREEILEALDDNKKKLEPLKEITVGQLVDLSKDTMVMAPLGLSVIQLLLERRNLKKALGEYAQSGTTLEDVK